MARTAGIAILILTLAAGPAAADWTRLTTEEIAAALADRDVTYENDAWQRFLPSGRTIYRWGETSWGYWRAEADHYCSQWPPAQPWECYHVEVDGQGGIRFTDDYGNVSTGVFAP